jgi:hypothetical protein
MDGLEKAEIVWRRDCQRALWSGRRGPRGLRGGTERPGPHRLAVLLIYTTRPQKLRASRPQATHTLWRACKRVAELRRMASGSAVAQCPRKALCARSAPHPSWKSGHAARTYVDVLNWPRAHP